MPSPKLLISDKKGRIYDFQPLEAVGMKAGQFFRLSDAELIKLPYGSELFMLPDRHPVGYDVRTGAFAVLKDYFAVAAFVSPGYTVTYNSPYDEMQSAKVLPLFSYGAIALYKGGFYIAAIRIDREKRQDLRRMDTDLIRENVNRLIKIFPGNRLVIHLKDCALKYSCPAAKNFFLQKYECPLPASPYCNSRCIGCISYQPDKRCSVTQPRIKFMPSPEEVSDVALFHMKSLKDPIVSFGQGCEGEPLLVSGILERSIKLIRKKTLKGVINLNTNASRPRALAGLFDAGLDSIRVSLNSVRETYYLRYYRPKDYKFSNVLESIKTAKQKRGFISLNYLTMPGFTDSIEEVKAFRHFVNRYKIDMIQWRNLNFDPLRYFKELKIHIGKTPLLGIKETIHSFKESFPHIMTGYFNPSKERIKRHAGHRCSTLKLLL